MSFERSVYFWYYRGDREAKAAEVAAIGATLAWVKAGGDRGVVWTPGEPTGGFAIPQWDDRHLAPLMAGGVECRPWFYNWPGEEDKGAVLRALAHRWSDAIALNPETEWRVQSPHSPYNSLAAANDYARAWVDDLRAQIAARFGRVPAIWFSSCPSWADFPYEGFAAACAGGHPQHYWHDELMARGENQVEAHFRRAPHSPCVALLTACREYDDAGVLRLAESAQRHPIAGFSAWEAGNGAFQADAMRRAFALLPAESVVKEPITGSPDGGPHARIVAEMRERLTYPQLGDVEGQGYVTVGERELALVEFQKYRAVLNGDSVEGVFVDPANPYSFAALDAAGKVRWG